MDLLFHSLLTSLIFFGPMTLKWEYRQVNILGINKEELLILLNVLQCLILKPECITFELFQPKVGTFIQVPLSFFPVFNTLFFFKRCSIYMESQNLTGVSEFLLLGLSDDPNLQPLLFGLSVIVPGDLVWERAHHPGHQL